MGLLRQELLRRGLLGLRPGPLKPRLPGHVIVQGEEKERDQGARAKYGAKREAKRTQQRLLPKPRLLLHRPRLLLLQKLLPLQQRLLLRPSLERTRRPRLLLMQPGLQVSLLATPQRLSNRSAVQEKGKEREEE